ncbi:hypothetical protein COY89_03895 [Candidatus Roizmanbacteria bacterium CG_4_10_14_0_8_um_filter_36_36]|uniref:Uncharacterized protein n=1 Tax=Candidatus Roizmanbacteria bacterium CG_4_8_14_3_um_filter_36_10 TaxID=1974834 RepID=A0A2M8GNE4_9BACT|nr:MAG: hypothetical protein COY89_03895 [Candidatus Roizmanbacteria bacterium CG_4_10_14_0_8_um_filter_36_36]PJC82066.1 MAG: hypothetical protein CO007_01435 [Candidatus Roizmanbacteria bacterium CG_4_8_14_3_um_filter_36_10]
MIDYHTTEILPSVRKAIIKGSVAAQLEKEGRRWRISWNSSVASYQETFKLVFPKKFNDFLKERKCIKKVYALDLMSSPAMLSGLEIDGGVAIGLGDLSNTEFEKEMINKNIEYIYGNLLTRQPWNDIVGWLKRNKAEGFDLITCRADMIRAHIKYVPPNPTVYYDLLNRAWNLLDKKGGVLLVDIPKFVYTSGIHQNLIDQWLCRLEENQIEYKYVQNSALKLVKNANSPKYLPTLN